jgi:hypothetical protein
MPRPLLDRLDEWKHRFEPAAAASLDRLLALAARHRLRQPAEWIRLHETLLFLRAYPLSATVAHRCDELLAGFARRLEQAGLAECEDFEDPEVSGIAGSALCGVFSWDAARALAARYPRDIEIAWDRYDEPERLCPALARILPLFGEEWPVEAHAPVREWMEAARPAGSSDLAWLVDALSRLDLPPRERADLYASLELPLLWRFPDPAASRSGLRFPTRAPLFVHDAPLLRRGDVSLARELDGPPLPVRRLRGSAARRALDFIHDSSAMRYRELYGFSHPDPRAVWSADLGRGNEVVFFGAPPGWRLPLRAYHAGMFFKNGVPAGYVETLSLFERAEVGFNLYYTFREGESAWLYARLLRLFRQTLGVTCFSVDPYQIGHENEEAVASGAFWFYRKLGFRPVEPAIAALVEREERRMRRDPAHRSSAQTLRKLAAGYILYETPGAQEPGAWDRFRIRNLGLAAQRGKGAGVERLIGLIPGYRAWSKAEKAAAAEIVRAKHDEDETAYLRLMQRHPSLRAALIEMGSSEPVIEMGSCGTAPDLLHWFRK